MLIERRDVEAFLKKEYQYKNNHIYLDDIEINMYSHNDKLYVECEKLMSLLKFYFNHRKHIKFDNQTMCISHPLLKFKDVKMNEDGIEITFK